MFVRGFKTWCENTALSLRGDLGLVAEDPLSPRELAKQLDIAVWEAADVPGADPSALRVLLHEDPDSWSAFTVTIGRTRVVVLNSTHSAARAASDLSHELAHIILGHDAARVDVSEDGLLLLHSFDRTQEDEANWLAGCLLIPREALVHIRRQGWTVQHAAKMFGVSVDMVQYRLNVTGVDVQLARRRSPRQ